MSATPVGPLGGSFGSQVKSFWARPEGKTGMIILGLIAAGVLWNIGIIIPFVLSMMIDLFHIALLAIGTVAILFVLLSKRTRLVFRLLSRWLTGLVIEIDPIGILKDKLAQARKRRDEMNDQIGSVRGSVQTLKDILGKNKQTIQQDLAIAEEAKKRSANAKEPAEQLRMKYEVQLRTNEIGRMERSNESYQALLQKISELYERLTKMAAGVDFFIADLEGTVREEEIKYKTINKVSSAFGKAMSIIRGSADEQDVYEQTLEYLADQASMKLGQIDDFTRLSQHFMDSMDLQNGVMDTKAAKELDAYEQKLLTSGDQGTIALVTGGEGIPQKEPVAVRAKAVDDDYFSK